MLKRIAPDERRKYSGVSGTNSESDGARPRRHIHHVTVLMALVGLHFMLLSGVARAQSADDGFNPGANIVVNALAVQPDGKILAGGGFSQLGGEPRTHIGRLNPNGRIDNTFGATPNGFVFALAVLPDGKILVGGQFTQVNGQSCVGICRLRPDGGVDTNF